MPLQRRIPKRGFTPRKRHVYQIVNVGDLARVDGTTVNAQTLRDAGLIRSTKGMIKLLAMGDLSQAYSVEAHKFSGGATAKIEAAGGSITTLGPAVRMAATDATPDVDPPSAPEVAATTAPEPEAAAPAVTAPAVTAPTADPEPAADPEAAPDPEPTADPEPAPDPEAEAENDG